MEVGAFLVVEEVEVAVALGNEKFLKSINKGRLFNKNFTLFVIPKNLVSKEISNHLKILKLLEPIKNARKDNWGKVKELQLVDA